MVDTVSLNEFSAAVAHLVDEGAEELHGCVQSRRARRLRVVVCSVVVWRKLKKVRFRLKGNVRAHSASRVESRAL